MLGTNAIGSEIRGGGQTLGKIVDAFIDQETGRLNYIVIQTSSELDFEPRLVPIPIETLDFNIFRRTLTVPLNEAELEEAPRLDEDAPTRISRELKKEIDNFYK